MFLWPTVLLLAVGAALLTVFEPVSWAHGGIGRRIAGHR